MVGRATTFMSTVNPSATWQPTRRQALLATPTLLTTLGVSASSPRSFVTPAAQAATPPIETYELAPGLNISRVIKGCWQLSGGHRGDRGSDRTTGSAAVEDFQPFVDAGITTFDTADIYGASQQLIGEYLKKHPSSRANCQVLTKFCCFGDSMQRARDARFVQQSIDASRKALNMDTLDCVQFYWHDYRDKGYVTAAQHLGDLQTKGSVRSVGVTNFDVPRLAEMVDAGVKIVSNQIQYSLLDTRPDNGMAAYCAERGIALLPYGTVAGGFLSSKYLGKRPEDVNVNTYSLSKYSSIIGQRGGWEWFQNLLQVLNDIGTKHGVGIAEVASRWVLQRPAVGAIIVGARNADHVAQHQQLFAFSLDNEDLAKIQSVLDSGVSPTSDCYEFERGGKW